MVFIRRLVNLKDIQILYCNEQSLDVFALNNERKRLKDACKVTIYVDERVYLAIKSISTRTTFELIEIKRKLSYNTVRPHSFY